MMELRLAPQEKLVLHQQFSAYLAGEKIYPVNVEISPSGVCQASCDFCWYAKGEVGSHRKVFLDHARLCEVLIECADMGVKSISWTGGGDPSLHPKIKELVSFTAALGLSQGMFTNSLAMPKFDPAQMEWIRITMTDKPYNETAIKALRPAKTLGFAFNYAGSQDDDYLAETIRVAERVGADYVQVRPALKFHGETANINTPDTDNPIVWITDYKFEEAKLPHGTHYTKCEGYHFVPFIWEDGNVDVCSYMRNYAGYTLGNIYQKSFRAIMNDAPGSVPVHDKCQVCCRNHEINKLIHASRKLQDRNFP